MMVNISSSFTNVTTNLTKISKEGETQNDLYIGVNSIITIIINCLTCPLTVLLNVLVIMAVKRRPRLQSNTNILLACLAATDVFTGLIVQPSFIMWKIFDLLGMPFFGLYKFHNAFLRVLSICSCLHLMMATCERLIAIKFTARYPYFVTTRNIKVVVIAVWVYSISSVAFKPLINTAITLNLLLSFALTSCVLFIAAAYIVLYRETLRHRKMIIAHQLPQEEVERFRRESKALKTTICSRSGSIVLPTYRFDYFVLCI